MVNLYAIICPEIRNRIEIPHMCGSININSSLEIRIQANEKEIAMRILDDFISNLIELGYKVETRATRLDNSKYDYYKNMIFSIPEDKIPKITITKKDLQILSNRMKSGDDFE